MSFKRFLCRYDIINQLTKWHNILIRMIIITSYTCSDFLLRCSKNINPAGTKSIRFSFFCDEDDSLFNFFLDPADSAYTPLLMISLIREGYPSCSLVRLHNYSRANYREWHHGVCSYARCVTGSALNRCAERFVS